MWVAVFNNNDSKQGLSYSSLANLFKKYTYTLPNRIASYQAASNVKNNPNDAIETGFYYVNGATNRPPFSQSTNNDYRLLVTAYSEIWLQQIATDFRCDDIYYRRRVNGAWTSWVRLAMASEVTSLSNDVKGNSEDITTLINTVNSEVEKLQTQIDGSITTWFYEVAPTTSNAPAKDWTTTDLKNVHLGDIYYDTITGYCYRWQVVNNVYSWQKLSDSDITKALNDSAKAQETADSKRRVFYSTPTVPYDKGDLWVGGSAGDIKYCTTAKAVGQTYAESDWSLASKYTDDTVANAAKTTADNALPNTGGTIKGVVKVQSGSANGAIILGADTSATTLTKDARHIGRIAMPISEDISKTMLVMCADTAGDGGSTIGGTGSNHNRLEFGGRLGAQSATAPDSIAFTVAKTHNAMLGTDKIYAMEMDATQARFNVKPNYSGNDLATLKEAKAEAEAVKTALQTNIDNLQSAVQTDIDNVQDSVDNIQIGGRNLYKGTGDFGRFWSSFIELQQYENDKNYKQAKCGGQSYLLATPTSSQGFSFNDKNKTWTISVMAKGTADGQKIGVTLDAGRINWSPQVVPNGTWKKLVWTFTGSTTLSTFRFEGGGTITAELPVYLAQVMVEEGNKATTWQPAPEDVDNRIDNIRAVPSCSTSNNGQFLMVVNGKATWTTVPNAEGVSF